MALIEISINTDNIETIMVALDSYKRKRIEDAFKFNREGIKDLADKAFHEAAALDVYWHGLLKLLEKTS